jgi:hypothetical protein
LDDYGNGLRCHDDRTASIRWQMVLTAAMDGGTASQITIAISRMKTACFC